MKKISFALTLFLYLTISVFAQKSAPLNWFNLDAKQDKFAGVSSNKAHQELLQNKTGKTVVVAVIDGGTDVSHEDLKSIIWTNEKEIAGNNMDDDKNGYVDDVNGWSFIGGKDSDVVEDTYELTRMYAALKPKYKDADTTKMSASEKTDYYQYIAIKKEYRAKESEATKMSEMMKSFVDVMNDIKLQLHTDTPTLEQVKNYLPGTPMETYTKTTVVKLMEKASFKELDKQVKDGYDYYAKGAKYSYNVDFNTRLTVGDDYNNQTQCCYGNNHVSGPKGEHGTHVAGIIAAIRDNKIGIDGVGSNVRIMVLRVVPDGDERDKDVANAIRYAADNGASIINMSFGKSYSPYKEVVDEAVKYAASKDVLIVHAAGNDGKNTDVENNFPRDQYRNSTDVAANWIEVGASSWKKRKYQIADFSNYGVQNVDLFAPGVAIYSTLPNNTYGSYDGTSMAGPVTAGVAALVRSYYPQLNAVQVKEVLMQSVVPVKGKVYVPGTKNTKAKMKELCVTGGIVNAYQALKLAKAKTGK